MIAQSVADILRDHVKLSVEGIDRMYLNVYDDAAAILRVPSNMRRRLERSRRPHAPHDNAWPLRAVVSD
jgi:hypothetical protein